jgi:hypothetical protein
MLPSSFHHAFCSSEERTMTHPETTLIRLLAAAHGHLGAAVVAHLRDHLRALSQATPAEHATCLAALEAWEIQHPQANLSPGKSLGRYRYRGQPATAYDADGLCGLVLDSASDGRHRLRLTPPPGANDPERRFVDAHWRHDDVAIRIEPGTYTALYRQDDGTWHLDHAPDAVPGLAPPLVE